MMITYQDSEQYGLKPQTMRGGVDASNSWSKTQVCEPWTLKFCGKGYFIIMSITDLKQKDAFHQILHQYKLLEKT